MVKKDKQFVVIDVKTKEDITRLTLVQIILDRETKGYELMPEDFIKQIIKFYDHPLNKIMQEYMAQAIKSFNSSFLSDSTLEQATNFSKNVEEFTKENLDYFNKLIFGKPNKPKKK
jgi:polyhydroxyalkanoate synthesis repressor PhaR